MPGPTKDKFDVANIKTTKVDNKNLTFELISIHFPYFFNPNQNH